MSTGSSTLAAVAGTGVAATAGETIDAAACVEGLPSGVGDCVGGVGDCARAADDCPSEVEDFPDAADGCASGGVTAATGGGSTATGSGSAVTGSGNAVTGSCSAADGCGTGPGCCGATATASTEAAGIDGATGALDTTGAARDAGRNINASSTTMTTAIATSASTTGFLRRPEAAVCAPACKVGAWMVGELPS